MEIRQAFVLAGGMGERLRPLTSSVPKPLVRVAGKPILRYNIELLAANGVERVILSTGYMHKKIEEAFGNGKTFGVEIDYSVEKEALGTGGALVAAGEMLDRRFFMLNGDNIADFALRETAAEHAKSGAAATITLKEVDDVEGFGVARVEGNRILEFVEKPRKGEEPSRLVNAGAYVIEKGCIGMMPHGFCLIEKALFPKLAAEGRLYAHIHGGYWFTTDTLQRLEFAEKAMKELENRQ